MEYIQTYELFNAGRITNTALNDLKMAQNKWNKLQGAVIFNNYKEFKYELNLAIKTMKLEKQDKNGNTALLLASKEGRLEMVKELIKAGANIQHKNNANEDFYDLAVNRYKFINGVKDWIEKTYPEFVMAKKYNL